MKLLLIRLAFFAALTAMANIAVIEPAHAYQEDKASACATDESQCCFFCCSTHHQWLPSTPSLKAFTNLIAARFIPSAPSVAPDPPAGSIFHPPQVF